MVVRKLILLVLTLLIGSSIMSQEESFIVQHGRKYKRNGIQSESDNNPYKRIKILNKSGTFLLTPNEVDAYSDKKGNYYESYEIDEKDGKKKYFLKLEYKNNLGSLYSCVDVEFKARLFIMTSELIELSNSEGSSNHFKSVLNELSTCANKERILGITNFNVPSMRRSLRSLEKCKIRFNPKRKVYLQFGYGNFTLNPNNALNDRLIIPITALTDQIGSRMTASFNLGVGLNIPINKSIISLDQAFRYVSYDQSILSFFSVADYRLNYNTQIIEYSPKIKLSSANSKWQLSGSVGPLVGLPINHAVELFSTFNIPNSSEVQRVTQEVEIGIQAGYEVSVQLEVSLTERFGLGLSGSLGQVFQIDKTPNKFSITRNFLGLNLIYRINE